MSQGDGLLKDPRPQCRQQFAVGEHVHPALQQFLCINRHPAQCQAGHTRWRADQQVHVAVLIGVPPGPWNRIHANWSGRGVAPAPAAPPGVRRQGMQAGTSSTTRSGACLSSVRPVSMISSRWFSTTCSTTSRPPSKMGWRRLINVCRRAPCSADSTPACASRSNTAALSPDGIDKLTVKSPFWLRFVFAHKIQPVDYHSYLFFNRVRKIKKSLIF